MKKLAIIGASYLQLPLVLKAKEMGFETHVLRGRMVLFAELLLIFFILFLFWKKNRF